MYVSEATEYTTTINCEPRTDIMWVSERVCARAWCVRALELYVRVGVYVYLCVCVIFQVSVCVCVLELVYVCVCFCEP